MRCAVLIAALSLVGSAAAWGEDWPSWRGPREDGTSTETNLPTRWSTSENIKWKTPLPGPGNSTPILVGERIFLTQATDKGATRSVLCLDRATGRVLWTSSVKFAGEEPTYVDNPYCSASPATDGKAVFAWHGSAGVVAYDFDGRELWRRDLGKFTHIWGNASSPVVHGDRVIVHCGPGERAFVVALDKQTGKTVWEVPSVPGKADAFLGSWSSPRLLRDAGQDLLLVAKPKALVALDPTDAKEIWSCAGLTDLVYTTPLVGEGAVVAMSGYHGKALAVKLGGRGDVTSERRLWITPDGKKEQQRVGSGIVRGGKVIMVNEPGTLEVIDLASGESQPRERVCGTTWSSLVLADGKFYIVDQKGTTVVFQAEPKLEIVSRNPLNETTNASLAVSDGHLYLRTYKHLWCIGAP